MSKTILITGGCGFIGHHFVEHVLVTTDWNIIILDKLNYASLGLERLRSIHAFENPRVKILTFDFQYPLTVGMKKEIGAPDIIVHMAAETHVDNSIADPVPFIHNNVMSTVNLLEFARESPNLKLFFYFSTDEVYGPALNDTLFTENDRHNPTNPYSASKSAAEQICIAYKNTYNIPLIRINVMNAFGERQHVEKFIPKVIRKLLRGESIQIHGYPDGKTSGSRFYIHARNIASAVLFLIDKGTIGECYNLSGEKEISNLEMATLIADCMNVPLSYTLESHSASRPGHDLRYGLRSGKLEELGWNPPVGLEESLKRTIRWTLINQKWLDEI
jgi:dTDP-glucose 4,6-dehydratase